MDVYDDAFPEERLRWKPVPYVIELEDGTEHRLQAPDTIALLDRVLNFDRIIIVVQDTVLVRKPSSYVDSEQKVREMYLKFIKTWNIADLDKVELVVCPGVGNFTNKLPDRTIRLSIRGKMYDF